MSTEYMPQVAQAYAIYDVPHADPSDDMLKCFSLRHTVKWLALIDFIFSLLFGTINPYFLIPILIAAIGYYGAKHYNKCIVLLYLAYITVSWITKLGLFIYYYKKLTSDSAAERAWGLCLVTLTTVVDIWISKLVYKFWRCMANMDTLELHALKDMGSPEGVRFVVW